MASKFACVLYAAEGKTNVMPCTAMHIPAKTDPKQWYMGTGTQTRTCV